jgi:hypothetical protein
MCRQGKKAFNVSHIIIYQEIISDKCNQPSKTKFKHGNDNTNTILKIYKFMNKRHKSAQKSTVEYETRKAILKKGMESDTMKAGVCAK